MRIGFYPRLAWSGIRKNKELYIPYLLTGMGMIMMYYIVSYLYTGSLLDHVRGGYVVAMLMGLGRFVVGAFSVIFLFYTQSFLIRRRKREFGLYSILGMNKLNLARIMIWESVIVICISLTSGLALGILFSKLAELLMNYILQADVDYSMRINPANVRQTVILYLIIFLLILGVTLRQVHVADPIQLLRSENVGERPPRANWPMALAGAVLLGIAYYLAVSIKNPVAAILWFFLAVLLVIGGTYLLFIAGSVTMCRLLQKNKRYYYKTNHFVSVSSMVYRMKRNGAGLASICILCTMVLVMLSSTVCLYGGQENSLRSRYPRHIMTDNRAVSYADLREENYAPIRGAIEEVLDAHGQTPAREVLEYSYVSLAGVLSDGVLETGTSALGSLEGDNYQDLWQIFVVSLADYNRLMGTAETLEPGQLLMCTTKMWFRQSSLRISGTEQEWQVRMGKGFVDNGVDSMQIIPSMFLFVEDVESFIRPMTERRDLHGNPLLQYDWIYGFDLECSVEEQGTIFYEIQGKLSQQQGVLVSRTESAAVNRDGFREMYGGLFFLGIMLSIVFVFATTLIMYYKQISEGYEDQSRFEILQKVGMTRKEVRKTINSQVMTVFFLPLLAAGIHLGFAFPFLYKGLMLLNFNNLWMLIQVAVLAYLLFGLGYVAVYRITSRAYYHLVGGAKQA